MNKIESNDDITSSEEKYVVYKNDLKFKNLRNIDPKKSIWDTEDVHDHYYNTDLDVLKYRLRECRKSKFTYLDLSHLGITEFPKLKKWKYYDELKNLKFLFLNNNKLTICDEALKKFTKLEVLDISTNQIKEITFFPKSLIEFVCHNNNLKRIPSHDNLKKLDCSSNKITELHSHQNLKDLICDHNRLEKIISYNNITRLVCSYNPLLTINTLNNATHLDCSNTKMSGRINDMPSLTHFICNFTKIDDISNLTTLQCLETLGGSITKIPYIDTLKDLLYRDTQDIILASKYKIIEHVKEHDNSYIRFA